MTDSEVAAEDGEKVKDKKEKKRKSKSKGHDEEATPRPSQIPNAD